MGAIAEGIAFAALCASAVWLETNGKPANGLWVLVVIWALTTDWGQKK